MSDNSQKVQLVVDHFHESFQSVVLATLTPDSFPYSSYAPFIRLDDKYYFLISKIAQHYTNLMNNPHASILMIEDESKTKNIFFRKRLSYLIDVELGIDSIAVKNEFIAVFGDMASMLFAMDFIIVKCHIIEGNIIVGPGQAYQINSDQKIKDQMTGNEGRGHTKA